MIKKECKYGSMYNGAEVSIFINELKAQRDKLTLEIMKLAIAITESKSFSVGVHFNAHVGWLEVELTNAVSSKSYYLLKRCCAFENPYSNYNPKSNYQVDYKEVIEDMEKCKQRLQDLLNDKMTLSDKAFLGFETY